ncbi:MAG: hypothetical protein DWB56_07935 [Candidatus Jettenia sp.]|nr:hypothetical protein [Candidatus Jettenia sp.]
MDIFSIKKCPNHCIYLNNNFRILKELPDIKQNLSHNIRVILFLMDEISKISETVSKTCDIGVIFKSGEILIAKNVSIEMPNFKLESV